jgi:hypothetical protein
MPEKSALESYRDSLATTEDLERLAARERTGTAVGVIAGFIAGLMTIKLLKGRKG